MLPDDGLRPAEREGGDKWEIEEEMLGPDPDEDYGFDFEDFEDDDDGYFE